MKASGDKTYTTKGKRGTFERPREKERNFAKSNLSTAIIPFRVQLKCLSSVTCYPHRLKRTEIEFVKSDQKRDTTGNKIKARGNQKRKQQTSHIV